MDVTVHVEVDERGAVTDSRVVSAAKPAFDDLAIAAVASWTFEPARRAGQPVASHTNVIVHFDPKATAAGETITITDKLTALVRGHLAAPELGAQDIRTDAKHLAVIPHSEGAAGMLTWAPGFLLTNEGGAGHAEQIFLRGFDAREGQDIELRVNGDVVNQVGNLHGNGYADMHFILPELVQSVRVVEGPYDPRQGNFAVAGSADYELGLTKRGLTASYAVGSFGTRRAVLLWGDPDQNAHNFAGVELYETDGFGQNRDARRATAIDQIEHALGDDGLWRLTTGAYLSQYHSAGILREDDYDAGRKDFYDTYDFGQGGSAARAFIAGDIEHHGDTFSTHQQLSFTAQTMRLREDFTGYLLDQQGSFQKPHSQRGDLLDLESGAFTAQAQGWARREGTIDWLDKLFRLPLAQKLELGYFARVDRTSGEQYRIEAATNHPYAKEADLDATLGDVGLYAALDLKLAPWLALRGGVRSDLLAYDVIDNCAAHSVAHPSKTDPPGDASCLSQEDFGHYREPVQRSTTAGSVLLPRASLVVGPFAGFSPSVSFGDGVRSIDPSYISQDVATPFARNRSYDAGLTYAATSGDVVALARLSGFRTHVDRDLVFSETEGRNVLAGGTSRLGGSLSGRATGSWFDANASVTLVRSTFDVDHLLVPYVPDVVVRTDTVAFGDWPYTLAGKPVRGTIGAGVTVVGPRALPYGQRGDTVATIDGSASVAWTRYTLSLSGENLLDRRYRLGEYNFASDFHSQNEPTLAIARSFTAGAPRTLLLKLEVSL
jgi:TonB family protein